VEGFLVFPRLPFSQTPPGEGGFFPTVSNTFRPNPPLGAFWPLIKAFVWESLRGPQNGTEFCPCGPGLPFFGPNRPIDVFPGRVQKKASFSSFLGPPSPILPPLEPRQFQFGFFSTPRDAPFPLGGFRALTETSLCLCHHVKGLFGLPTSSLVRTQVKFIHYLRSCTSRSPRHLSKCPYLPPPQGCRFSTLFWEPLCSLLGSLMSNDISSIGLPCMFPFMGLPSITAICTGGVLTLVGF